MYSLTRSTKMAKTEIKMHKNYTGITKTNKIDKKQNKTKSH